MNLFKRLLGSLLLAAMFLVFFVMTSSVLTAFINSLELSAAQRDGLFATAYFVLMVVVVEITTVIARVK